MNWLAAGIEICDFINCTSCMIKAIQIMERQREIMTERQIMTTIVVNSLKIERHLNCTLIL